MFVSALERELFISYVSVRSMRHVVQEFVMLLPRVPGIGVVHGRWDSDIVYTVLFRYRCPVPQLWTSVG